ncbi:unnamed protein product [Vitrella brassicaformis CCMP3155]|uniref:14-3-3 domain-containing protein n=1 Tax=Vitrella brassicaformis (strain CCMP3155) TaxID=1169540 RepID=A0A0G4EUI0_VITBC|nr:unnamed protein product [Vitrella brassicaformis CCMP3155]|eukprot:CEM02083.1 unnamed protein product [Vitrella brassicaformis CCMP3155]
MARLAEQSERYDDMVEFMRRVATLKSDLTLEERNLFSIAYKNSLGTRRAAWRVLWAMDAREPQRTGPYMDCINLYRAKVIKEMKTICSEMLKIIEEDLLPLASTTESRVFYWKLKGDYLRYTAEFHQADAHTAAAESAHDAYKTASEIALNHLTATHPVRLGLALNFSVFYYETINAPDKACQLAKAAFDEAIGQLETLGEEQYKDSAMILQLLRDNLTLWTQGVQGAAVGEESKAADAR